MVLHWATMDMLQEMALTQLSPLKYTAGEGPSLVEHVSLGVLIEKYFSMQVSMFTQLALANDCEIVYPIAWLGII
jgi:hypothetical protein